jgi:hypothetical protein
MTTRGTNDEIGCWRLRDIGFSAASCKLDRPQTEAQVSSAVSVAPATMARVGAVEDRFQSYNIEMLEVTGGASLS